MTDLMPYSQQRSKRMSERLVVCEHCEKTITENAALKRENERLEDEIYNAIYYEPHETDSWGKLTNKQLMALNDIGRRLAYKRQERILLTEQEDA